MFALVCFITAFISGYVRYDMVETSRHKGVYYKYASMQYGVLTAILSSIFFTICFFIFKNISENIFFFISLFFTSIIFSNILIKLIPDVRPTNEKIFKYLLWISASFALIVTVGIILSLLGNTFIFFENYNIIDFLFGTIWSPQIAIREDQVGASGKFGVLPLLSGTLLITFIALLVAIPIGIGVAIYLSEFATKRFRAWTKPILEILAGIPTVVYGFFAAVTVAPFIKNVGTDYGFLVSSESALAAGSVMGIMIVPYVSSLSDDVLHSVPQSLRDGARALAATDFEMISRVIFPAALPGIISAFILAFSRAIGETMIVLMAAGLAGNLTLNPLDSVTTFTVQIGTLLTGDQEFDSIKTLSAFALGSTLFILTFILNIIAVRMIQKYKANYG